MELFDSQLNDASNKNLLSSEIEGSEPWEKLFHTYFFVFSFREFVQELQSLLELAREMPEKKFFHVAHKNILKKWMDNSKSKKEKEKEKNSNDKEEGKEKDKDKDKEKQEEYVLILIGIETLLLRIYIK